MRKCLLLLLACISSMSYSFSVKNTLWSIFGPVESVDGVAEARLKLWHEKRDEKYLLPDYYDTYDGRSMAELRSKFPLNDPTSKDRVAKVILLAEHSRLMRVVSVAADPYGGQSQTFVSDRDYEETWKEQPLLDRFYWTVRYRRPYTYVLSLAKWSAEVTIIAGCIKLIQKLKKMYQKK